MAGRRPIALPLFFLDTPSLAAFAGFFAAFFFAISRPPQILGHGQLTILGADARDAGSIFQHNCKISTVKRSRVRGQGYASIIANPEVVGIWVATKFFEAAADPRSTRLSAAADNLRSGQAFVPIAMLRVLRMTGLWRGGGAGVAGIQVVT